MAGIGFVLRRLAREDNLLGLARSFAHSTMASAGPWIFTVAALATITAISVRLTTAVEVDNFRLIIIYNFAFTLAICSPVLMIQTRCLADSLWLRDMSKSIGILVGTSILLFCIQFPLVVAFYFLYAKLDFLTRLAAISNYMAIVLIWPIAVFLSALKDYNAVSWSFVIGLVIALLASGYLAPIGAEGILAGFTLGLMCTCAILIARVFIEYPFKAQKLFVFLPYFRNHRYVWLAGLFSGLAIWVDKWIMWFFAPEAERAANNLVTYPNYDSAMFLSYLTIVPSLAVFMIIVETDFFESYLKFFRDIQRKATLQHIERNHSNLLAHMIQGGKTMILVQGSVTLITVLSAPALFSGLGVNFLQLAIFRYGAVGTFFQMMATFAIIMLSYFNNIKAMFYIYTFFAVTNALFTYLLLPLGFAYYGLGFVLSTIATFLLASFIMIRHAAELPYHTFVTSNSSVD